MLVANVLLLLVASASVLLWVWQCVPPRQRLFVDSEEPADTSATEFEDDGGDFIDADAATSSEAAVDGPALEEPASGPVARPGAALLLFALHQLLLFGAPLFASGPPPNPDVVRNVDPNRLTVGLLIGIGLRFALLLGYLGCLRYGGTGRLADFGVTSRPRLRDLRWGTLACVLSLAPVYAVLITLQQLGLLTEQDQHPFLQLLTGGGRQVVVAILVTISACVLAPLLEELEFRVVFQGELARQMPVAVAVVLSSLVFSFAHGIPNAFGLIPLALLLGLLYLRTGRYWPCVVAHALFNAWSVILALVFAV